MGLPTLSRSRRAYNNAQYFRALCIASTNAPEIEKYKNITPDPTPDPWWDIYGRVEYGLNFGVWVKILTGSSSQVVATWAPVWSGVG